jgi:hypothetical protein
VAGADRLRRVPSFQRFTSFDGVEIVATSIVELLA